MDVGLPLLFAVWTKDQSLEKSSPEAERLGVVLDVVSEDTSVGLEETLVTKQSLSESTTTEGLGHP